MKKHIAARQYYKCANKPGSSLKGIEKYECPLWKNPDILYRGNFDDAGYEIDHIIEFSKNHNDDEKNLQALCHSCHHVKTKNFMRSPILKVSKSTKLIRDKNTNKSNDFDSEEDESTDESLDVSEADPYESGSESDSGSEEEMPDFLEKTSKKCKTPVKVKSLYQIFISKELNRQRQKIPGLENKEYMKLATNEWNKYKKRNGIITGGSKTADISKNTLNRCAKEKDFNSEEDEMSDSSGDDIYDSEEDETSDASKKTFVKPKSRYQIFIFKEVNRQRKKIPGLENKEYMNLATKEWHKYKKRPPMNGTNTRKGHQ
jgi:hypothetical protein